MAIEWDSKLSPSFDFHVETAALISERNFTLRAEAREHAIYCCSAFCRIVDDDCSRISDNGSTSRHTLSFGNIYDSVSEQRNGMFLRWPAKWLCRQIAELIHFSTDVSSCSAKLERLRSRFVLQWRQPSMQAFQSGGYIGNRNRDKSCQRTIHHTPKSRFPFITNCCHCHQIALKIKPMMNKSCYIH